MLESGCLEVLKEGAKELQEVSTPWDFTNESSQVLNDLIHRMKMTLRSEGGIGLAAPQVGLNKRLFVIEVHSNERYGNLPNIPFEVFINPQILRYERRTCDFVEGCLSVDNFRITINRPRGLWVRWQNQTGRYFRQKLTGIRARIFQHEYDHLEGILITDYLI
tara:strand:- start:187 stop:675 length:489 start_codon:yes stop_codon:yes gene_type:complete